MNIRVVGGYDVNDVHMCKKINVKMYKLIMVYILIYQYIVKLVHISNFLLLIEMHFQFVIVLGPGFFKEMYNIT
jgi:hypothetical protein